MMRVLLRLAWRGVCDLAINPWAQLAALSAVIMVSLLSGLFLMALNTMNQQLGQVRGETVFQVYWSPDTDMAQVREQWQSYQHMPGFQYAKTYTPEEALAELGQRLGRTHGQLERGFPFLADKSPLPATALLSFICPLDDAQAWIADTTRYLESQPGVSRVAATPLHDELGRAWRNVSQYVMWPSVFFLTLVPGLVVGGTMRLSLAAREQEIEILKLAGAFNWYIRTPLVVSGAFLGLIGSAAALGLLYLLHSEIRNVLNFPPLLMEIRFIQPQMAAGLIFAPMLTAAAASWLAVRGK